MVILLDYFIEYYYCFSPTSIYIENDYYVVWNNKQKYYLFEVQDEELIQWQHQVTISSFFNSFVKNKFNSIFSVDYEKKYVLLKDDHDNRAKFSLTFVQRIIFNWDNIWIKKSDFLEKYYYSIRGKYSIIDDSFHYFLGLLEMAHNYIKDYSNYEVEGFLQYKKYSSIFFHNPINICLDVKERNFGEYLKYIFWNNEYKSIDLSLIIWENRNNYDFNLVIGRVLYPNYYFDLLDQFFLGSGDLLLLKNIIDKIEEFEDYVSFLIFEIQKFFPIKKVSF